jgi:hypothetical protein
MWSCLGKGDYDGVKRLLSYLKEVKKQHILKLKSKKETMPVEHKQICAHLDTGNVSLDGFRVDIGNGFAAVVSQENNEPNVSVVSRSLVEIPMTRAEWDALLSTGPVISSIFELIS